jgi:CelD/BcsL family acetyltransferase involved in cellulose biosynthesis
VYMLQTGFSLESDNTKRPGYVSHCLAIVLNTGLGFEHYDFMCGEAEYKRTLGEESASLAWLRLHKPLLKFRLETAVEQLYRTAQQYRSALLERLRKLRQPAPATSAETGQTERSEAD